MTKFFNKTSEKVNRRKLRSDMPPAEAMLWLKLRGRQLNGYKFRRQYGVGKFVVDFYCPKLKLAIELDGETHFIEKAEEYDIERQKFIESFNIKFLRFTNLDVYKNLEGVLERIAQYLP